MEPGHEDREYDLEPAGEHKKTQASMEPGHEDREYAPLPVGSPTPWDASMEPGHEDREYILHTAHEVKTARPQWSPVMKTGNTRA